ncbi:hypothetical protein [Halobacillus sp. BBL2006]|uniref:hypothetical protein n=1 Tax=Halobacillus sp. BBL2006 TaxID=1543706 RepID=UPI000AA5125C|nr:hypothetical protein [Halobacillus sp. BBL2006]
MDEVLVISSVLMMISLLLSLQFSIFNIKKTGKVLRHGLQGSLINGFTGIVTAVL